MRWEREMRRKREGGEEGKEEEEGKTDYRKKDGKIKGTEQLIRK